MTDAAFQKVRDDTKRYGEFSIIRETFVEEGGCLRQEMAILHRDTPISAPCAWMFEPRESFDGTLKVLDHHWKKLGHEVREIIEQAHYYYDAKTGGKDATAAYTRGVLNSLSSVLLHQKMADDECHKGVIHAEEFPLTCVSERLAAMRNSLANHDMKKQRLDRHEHSMMAIYARLGCLVDAFAKGNEGMEEGLQGTAGEGGDESWRGDQHRPREREESAAAGWREKEQPEQDGEYRMGRLLERYHDSALRFTDAANRIWMEAVQQIRDKRPVTVNADEVERMTTSLAETRHLHAKLEEAAAASGMAFEYREFREMLENTVESIEPRMQAVLNMVSRREQLEREIRKGLPRGRGRE